MVDKYKRFQDTDIDIDLSDDEYDGHLQRSHYNDLELDLSSADEEDITTPSEQDENCNHGHSVTYSKKEAGKNIDPADLVKIVDFKVENGDQEEITESTARLKLKPVLEHLAFRSVTILLVLLDICLVIADLARSGNSLSLEIVSLIILSYFVIECALRIYVQSPAKFVRHWIEVVDAVVIVVSFVFAILPIALSHLSSNAAFMRLIVAGRLIRIVLIIRLITEKKSLEKATRLAVSQNKRRYQKDGFDLDLCYITSRVIAMSFPSSGFMAFYRNPIKEVARFLDTKHKDHYQIFNLCSERMYDESIFHHRVRRYRIDDHNVPKLHELIHFSQMARTWLEANSQNIIAVHCKGGKGRTGTIICTWLVECGAFEEAKESLDFFGDRRTDLSVGSKFQGVETPSQSRYVGYFEKVKRFHDGELPPEQSFKMISMCIKGIASIGEGNGSDLRCHIITESKVWVYDLGKQVNCEVSHNNVANTINVDLKDVPVLKDDIKVMFYSSHRNCPKGYDDCLFYFWFHTSFIEDNKLWLPREELDNPHKEKTWNIFKDDFGIRLTFEPMSKLSGVS